MKMTNRELETRYMHMKQTWKTLVDANVSLVDENKDLKEEIERLNNIINELEKELNKDFNTYMTRNRQNGKIYKAGADNYRMHIYLKLQELKGEDKE